MNLNDLNWKTGLLIAVIVLGASLEIIKRLPQGDSLPTAEVRSGQVQAQHYNVRAQRVAGRGQPPAMLPAPRLTPPARPIAKAAQIPAMTKEQMEKFAKSLPKTTEFEHDKKKAKKKKGKDDEWEIVVDPVTGKRIKRRKKKVAKAEEKKEEVVQKEEPKKDEEPPAAEEDNDIDAAVAAAMTTGRAPLSNSTQPDDAFASAQEWMRKLLSRPNLAETKRFIDHYNKALVTPDVFYKVVHAMVTDSRAEMKKLGVLCLGSTPSVLSFQMLAQVIKAERAGSPAQKDAEGFADGYKEIGRLPLLERVLRSSSGSFPTVLATQKVEASAEKHLNTANQQQQNGAAQPAAPVRNYSTNFQRFVPVLNNLTKSKDQAIKDQAARTLGVLNNLLNNSGTPVSPAPTQTQAGVVDPNSNGGQQAAQF